METLDKSGHDNKSNIRVNKDRVIGACTNTILMKRKDITKCLVYTKICAQQFVYLVLVILYSNPKYY